MKLGCKYSAMEGVCKDKGGILEELQKFRWPRIQHAAGLGVDLFRVVHLLREMIEKIVVHECSYDENGTRGQDIEIYYSFVGKIDLPEA